MTSKSGCNLAWGNERGQLVPGLRARTSPAARGRRPSILGATSAALFLLGLACAKQPVTPTTSTLEAEAARAYRSLVESLGIDPGPVRGRVVVLDPGHGGGYRGALGQRGTAEADVNLAVALFLWGLLDDAGAEVYLTRTADRDFVGGELHPPAIQTLPREGSTGSMVPHPAANTAAPPDSLRSDLAARIAAANTLNADLFLSIHHNADASGDTTRNQTQTFYRLGDAGPSLDAAQAIHRHLMRNLGTARGQVQPGNYYVLRSSNATAAVLGEPSFLTNPLFEEKLVRIDRVELEAVAYFLGIVDHFARGVARVAVLAPRDTVLDAATTVLRARFSGDPIDPATVALTLDGAPLTVRPHVEGGPGAAMDFIAFPPEPLANGRHVLTARARTFGGNGAAPASASFVMRRPPAELSAEPWPLWNGTNGYGPLGLVVSVRDRFGLAVADSTPVDLTSPVRGRQFTTDGQAWFRLESSPAPEARWTVESGPAAATLPVMTEGAPPHLSGSVVDRSSGRGISGAEMAMRDGRDFRGRTNLHGEYAISLPTDLASSLPAVPGELRITAPGYLPRSMAHARDATRIELDPVLGGVLHGRRVAVDPAGGGADPVATSATGVRAADTALDIALRLASDLERSGATATLLRAEDRTIPDLARVEAAEQAAVDRYIRIGADPAPRIRHYPGSRRGVELARAAAREIARESGLALEVRAEVTPVLLTTSMPAVEILLPAPAGPAGEDAHLDPDFRRRVARAILLAAAAESGLDLDRQATVILKSDAPHLLVDGMFIVQVNDGQGRARGIDRGTEHEVLPLAEGMAAGPQVTRFRVAAPPPDTITVTVPMNPAAPAPTGRAHE